MPHKESNIPENEVFPLTINGLSGRLLRIPNTQKKREILFIYGHHASLERMYVIAKDLSAYGTVTMPDLPGFGGMDSLYTIGEEPSLDILADYLASVIKLRYKQRRITIMGFSIGFAIVTRMLEKYPELAARVDLLVSVAGFTHHSDFSLPRRYKGIYKYAASFFAGKWRARLFRRLALNSFVILVAYRWTRNARAKFRNLDRITYKKMIRFDIELWHNNDVRTYMRTTVAMFTADLTRWRVNLPVRHISFGDNDQYFDEARVIEHMKTIYSDCIVLVGSVKSHMPSVIASVDETKDLFPKKLRNELSRAPKS